MNETLKTLPVWHEREILLQQKVGVADRMTSLGQRVIRDFMPDQHRDFYAQLPYLVVVSVENRGDAGPPSSKVGPASCILLHQPRSTSRPRMMPATPRAKV